MQKWFALVFVEIARILFDKLVEWARAFYHQLKKDQEIQAKTDQQAEAVRQSTTESEDERAAREILSRKE